MATEVRQGPPSEEEMLAAINGVRAQMETDPELCERLTVGKPSGNPITLGRRIPSPADMTALQIKGVEDNKKKWLERVTHPHKNFKEEALRPEAQARYKASMEKVIAENLHAGGMKLVNESEAMATIELLGPDHYAKAVKAREAKILRVANELDTDRVALCEVIDKLDVSTDEKREDKMVSNVRGLRAIGKKRRGVVK